jgi:hypothetical protein
MADGTRVPIEQVSRDGVRLFGESSAWPRDVVLNLRPVSPGTKERLDTARQKHGWGRHDVKLDMSLDQGDVVLRGATPDALPSGFWDVTFDIYDVVANRNHRIEIPDNGECLFEVPVKNDVKAMRVKDEAAWDAGIRRVLAASTLDGITGDSFVRRPDVRASRRACALNVLAVCRAVGLADEIEQLFLAEVDRVFARVGPTFRSRLEALGTFHPPKPPGHEIHRRVLDGHGFTDAQKAGYTLLSYRQKGNPSMQVVTASPANGQGPHFADLDIDLGDVYNPRGFFIHAAEVTLPQRTDHLTHVRQLLQGTPAHPFLCWDPA